MIGRGILLAMMAIGLAFAVNNRARADAANSAPATRPATVPAAAAAVASVPPSPLDAEAIHRGDDSPNPAAVGANGSNSSAATGTPPVGMLRIALALIGVIGLIVAMKIAIRWMWPGAASQRASRLVRVIARTPLTAKSALVLVKIGKRLVVVGDAGTQLSSICQITDPDEVAEMLGAIQTERLGSAAGRFAIRLGRARGEYDDESVDMTAGESGEAGAGNSEADASALGDDAAAESTEPAALASTHQELRGLAGRVRALAEQFRKPNG